MFTKLIKGAIHARRPNSTSEVWQEIEETSHDELREMDRETLLGLKASL
jgi:hypothetical protein